MYLLGGTLEENAHKAHRKLVFAQEIIFYLAHAPNGHLERTQSVGWKIWRERLECLQKDAPPRSISKWCSFGDTPNIEKIWRYKGWTPNGENIWRYKGDTPNGENIWRISKMMFHPVELFERTLEDNAPLHACKLIGLSVRWLWVRNWQMEAFWGKLNVWTTLTKLNTTGRWKRLRRPCSLWMRCSKLTKCPQSPTLPLMPSARQIRANQSSG